MHSSARARLSTTGPLLALALFLPLAANAQADLSVTATKVTCDPCQAGKRVTLFTTVTNGGPSSDPSVYL